MNHEAAGNLHWSRLDLNVDERFPLQNQVNGSAG
jgi:hypothetical protein